MIQKGCTVIYLGLAQWSNPAWQQRLYGKGSPTAQRLEKYAQVFNSVEGSTTFYATPSIPVATQWARAVPEHFRFTFKLPQTITHQQKLQHSQRLLNEFFNAMTPLIEKTGIWNIQLPASFGPESLLALERFIKKMPSELHLGVEVRHPLFFSKGDEERRFNALLMENDISRIIMDSRPVFSHYRDDAALIDAQQKKPRVPVHAIATSHSPMIRFIGIEKDNHIDDWRANLTFFDSWVAKIPQWLAQDRSPYLMIHTPDNMSAPELATKLYERLKDKTPDLPTLPSLIEQEQDSQLTLL